MGGLGISNEGTFLHTQNRACRRNTDPQFAGYSSPR
jgi:hypothetical protein